jgi:glucose-6-phosphate-specific signal transduction histidine kinase
VALRIHHAPTGRHIDRARPERLSVGLNGPDQGPIWTVLGPGTGLGLIGMRERVELVGGTLTAGPRTGGGFEVRALLPARSVACSV